MYILGSKVSLYLYVNSSVTDIIWESYEFALCSLVLSQCCGNIARTVAAILPETRLVFRKGFLFAKF